MLVELKQCNDIKSLAYLLGYKSSSLSYILFKIPDKIKYVAKTIPKKDGSDRHIFAPTAKLKSLQRSLSDLLYDCLLEIETASPHKRVLSFGYSKKIGIIENANIHRKARFVFNVDIKNFFDTIHIGRVMGFFAKDKNFSLDPDVAKLVAQICCYQGKLPQGAPTSPIVSDLVGRIIDSRLAQLATRYRCRYSRYVDDITFSFVGSSFPPQIAAQDASKQGWEPGPKLLSAIARCGFELNDKKTRMSVRSERQIVTGLVANDKANATLDFRKRTRAMCHKLFMGEDATKDQFFLQEADQEPASLSYIEGRLNFQYEVDHRFDRRSESDRRKKRSVRDWLYYDFLIYKNFYGQTKPTIVTEGLTDPLYLEAAILSLRANDPRFVDASGPNPKLAIRILRRTPKLLELTGLTGGAGNLKNVLIGIHNYSLKYPTIASSPSIFLFDNDSGGKDAFGAIKSNFGKVITLADQSQFFRLRGKLYVVKTPSLAGKVETFIESFLPQTLLLQPINGRTFSLSENMDPNKHFGKTEMARYVRQNAASISFAGFADLVDRIDSALMDGGY